MSKETLTWLNQNVLIGYTDKRGTAWHYKASEQGAEPNHYAGAIPVGDVQRRLFHWNAVERPVYQAVPGTMDDFTIILPDGTPSKFEVIEGRKAIVRDDTNAVLGIHSGTPGKNGYLPHQYSEWLLGNIANLLSDELGIGSAGLLKGGAVAWVQVEVPETISTAQGVDFRANLTAYDSLDGSLATWYKRMAQVVVCDNTLARGIDEKGKAYSVKHTKYSNLKIEDARKALELVETTGQEFADEIARLCAWNVSDKDWAKLLDKAVPVPDGEGRGKTLAVNKRDSLRHLYNSDERVAPWKGTAWGALMAFNTHAHHVATVRNVERAERNMSNALLGITQASDAEILKALAEITPAPAYA